MHCSVLRLRIRGVRLPSPSAGSPVSGLLELDELQASALGRSSRIARLRHPTQPLGQAELIPPLLDAQLLQVRGHRLVLSGIEREPSEGGMVDYAQTWLVTLRS